MTKPDKVQARNSKYAFQFQEQRYLTGLLIKEHSSNRRLWKLIHILRKIKDYLTHPARLRSKLKHYFYRYTKQDALQIQMPDSFAAAFERKSLDYLNWCMEENNQQEDLKAVDQLIRRKEYKGIIVYPTTIPWEPLQRPQQLLREFARLGYLCLYCEEFEPRLKLKEIDENLYTVSGEQYLIFALQNYPVITLCTWMMNLPFINLLPRRTLWYDIIDRLEIFSLYDRNMLTKHWQVIQGADIISYSAQNLRELAGSRTDAIYIPNGVLVEDFIQTAEQMPRDDSLLQLMQGIKAEKKPIIGFFGAIAEWLDLKMIHRIAEQRKDWEFVFIGRSWTDVSEIKSLPNVHLTGLVPYHKLKIYASKFDVAIVPFIVNELTNSVSPIKFFEYAALGLPIVSTPFYEVQQYRDQSFIRFADGAEGTIAAIEDLLKHTTSILADEAQRFAWENHWKERVFAIDQQFHSMD